MSDLNLKTLPPARRRRTRAKATILVTLALSFVGVWILLDRVADVRLEKAIAEADRSDPLWRQADLWASRAPVLDAENSALRVRMVLDQLPERWMAKRAPNETPAPHSLAELSERLSQLDPVRRLSDQDGRRLHAQLDELKPARSLALELARMPRGRYKISAEYVLLHEPTDHAEKLRHVVRLLQLEAVDRIERKDIDGALDCCCAIFNAGRSIGDEPNVFPQLVRIAADSAALHTVQRALAQGRPSDPALSRVQECLDRESKEPILLFALRGDRATAYDTFQRLADGDIKIADWAKVEGKPPNPNWIGFPRPFVRYNQALLLESTNRAVAIAGQPLWEQPKLWTQYEADRKSHSNGPGLVVGFLAEILSPAHEVTGRAFLRIQALLRVGQVMVAVERFRLVHGHWPDSIDRLVPRFLAERPADPFTARDLVLRKLSDGVTIYSLGSDHTDNGGKFRARGRDEPGYDLGYRLWDERVRGQPSKRSDLPENVFAPD